MDFADMLRIARRGSGLSQRALAETAGVPQSTVARVESGALRPRVDTVERLLDALGYELELSRRPGRGVDRTLIRRMLALTPRERLVYAVSAGEAVTRLRHASQTRM